MLETLAHYIQKNLKMEIGTAIHFKKAAPHYFYLNGIIPVSLVSIGRPYKDGYICYCTEVVDGYHHVVEVDKLHVNKLDTTAAKLLYSKR